MGTVFKLPVVHVDDLARSLTLLSRNNDMMLVAAAPGGNRSLRNRSQQELLPGAGKRGCGDIGEDPGTLRRAGRNSDVGRSRFAQCRQRKRGVSLRSGEVEGVGRKAVRPYQRASISSLFEKKNPISILPFSAESEPWTMFSPLLSA